MAALIGGARRPRQRPGAKDWLRIANRLAAGLPPRAAALPEGGDEALVERLLAREEFRAFVAASTDCLAEPPETQHRRLVLLARQALERALMGDEAPVAVFVLEEEFHDRDPAVTLAEGVMRARSRSLRPPAERPSKPRPGRCRWDPLRRMMQRGAARLREDIAAEDAIRHAAAQAAAGPVALRHGLWSRPGSLEPVEVEPPPAESGPRQAQAP